MPQQGSKLPQQVLRGSRRRRRRFRRFRWRRRWGWRRLPERLLRLRSGKGVCMNDYISHLLDSLALAHPQTYTLLAIGVRRA